MRGPRNLILKFHERVGDRRPLGLSDTRAKGGGRVASLVDLEHRHRSSVQAAEGPSGIDGCKVIRVAGTKQSWSCSPHGAPERHDVLVAVGGRALDRWLKCRVVAVGEWDYGRTLEIIVRVLDEAPTRRVVAGVDRLRAKARRVVAAATALAITGAAMADQPQSGTYAHLPLDDMQEYLRKLGQFPREVRPLALNEVAEAVLSEAQVDAPVLTGTLQNSHTEFEDTSDRDDGSIVIGANTVYALPVHETHPTKKRWFTRAIVRTLPRAMERVLRRLARQKGAR
ncbi:MAG: HK97 gp10 family phage protein [Phycisphaerales bacterium]|nr:HK97 gp10 family phage protein [Phycisphaerales bacterium]